VIFFFAINDTAALSSVFRGANPTLVGIHTEKLTNVKSGVPETSLIVKVVPNV
jgi:hypothetical protein